MPNPSRMHPLAAFSARFRPISELALNFAAVFWWQGDKDSRDMGLSTHYEQNLVALIKQLRVQYNAPSAKFVAASLGQTVLPNATKEVKKVLGGWPNIRELTQQFDGNSLYEP